MQVNFISLVLGVLFVCSGLFKAVMLPEQEQLLTNLGFPGWVLLVVGGVEVLLGALILSPRWRPWAALAMALEMVVAALAHLISGTLVLMVLANAALFVAATYVLVKERANLVLPRTPRSPRRHPTH